MFSTQYLQLSRFAGNLATCLEKLQRKADAAEHWSAYLELDPHSEWAEIARQQLSVGAPST